MVHPFTSEGMRWMRQLAYILQLLPPTVCAQRSPEHLTWRALFAGVYLSKRDGTFSAVLCLTLVCGKAVGNAFQVRIVCATCFF